MKITCSPTALTRWVFKSDLMWLRFDKHSSPYTIIIPNRKCRGCLILYNFLTCYNSQACTVRWPSIWLPGNSYSYQRWIGYPTREGKSSQHAVCPIYDYPNNIQTPLLSTVATPSLSCSLNRDGCLFLVIMFDWFCSWYLKCSWLLPAATDLCFSRWPEYWICEQVIELTPYNPFATPEGWVASNFFDIVNDDFRQTLGVNTAVMCNFP